MNTLILILIILTWLLSGIISFIYWWTRDYDYKSSEIFTSLFAGLLGPFAFILGYTIHGKEKALIKHRTGS